MSVKPSPSVLRSARLLTELALRPTEEATLSDLARRVGISKASCQCLLMALVEEGLAARDESNVSPRTKVDPSGRGGQGFAAVTGDRRTRPDLSDG